MNIKRKIRRLKEDFWFSWLGNVIWYMFSNENYHEHPRHGIRFIFKPRNWKDAFRFAKDMTR